MVGGGHFSFHRLGGEPSYVLHFNRFVAPINQLHHMYMHSFSLQSVIACIQVLSSSVKFTSQLGNNNNRQYQNMQVLQSRYNSETCIFLSAIITFP